MRLSCFYLTMKVFNVWLDISLLNFFTFPEPFYDSVIDDEDDNDLIVAGMKKFSLKAPSYLSLRLRPWESSEPSDPLSEVSLIDFGDDSFSSASPSPITDIPASVTTLSGTSILDSGPPPSPYRGLPNPLHPTPAMDWDSYPLPSLPAYDEVALEREEQEDVEVQAINSEQDGQTYDTVEGDMNPSETQHKLEDNMFLPSKLPDDSRSFCQSADIFKELQREAMAKLQVPGLTRSVPASPLIPHRKIVLPLSDNKPQIPPRLPVPPTRPSRRTRARLSVSLGDDQDRTHPPQIPPRDHALSQPGSRSTSPMISTHQRPVLCCVGSLGSCLSPSVYSHASSGATSRPSVSPSRVGTEPNESSHAKPNSRHYYLLPEKPACPERYGKFSKDSEGNEERRTNMATVRPMVQISKPNFSNPSGTSQTSAYSNVKQVSSVICLL